jgi:hypothetical protein
MSTALDSYGPAPGKSSAPPRDVVGATVGRRVSEVDGDRDATPQVTTDRRPNLSDLVGEWRWRPDPDDHERLPSAPDTASQSTADHELIRVYLWAQILIG